MKLRGHLAFCSNRPCCARCAAIGRSTRPESLFFGVKVIGILTKLAWELKRRAFVLLKCETEESGCSKAEQQFLVKLSAEADLQMVLSDLGFRPRTVLNKLCNRWDNS